jgi:hypothetical protein
VNSFLNGNSAKRSYNQSSLKHLMPIQARLAHQGKAVGILHAWLNLNKGIQAMTKSLEVISETIRNPKHPFRKVDNQPKKSLKHRYERRKIKEYLHLGGEWATSDAT